jgi:hypothetical protein
VTWFGTHRIAFEEVSVLNVKQGTILRLQCTHTSGDDVVDLTGVTVTSAARLESSAGESELHELTATLTDAASGVFELEADTTEWTRGRFKVDVKFAASGSRYWSETFHVSLAEPVTP